MISNIHKNKDEIMKLRQDALIFILILVFRTICSVPTSPDTQSLVLFSFSPHKIFCPIFPFFSHFTRCLANETQKFKFSDLTTIKGMQILCTQVTLTVRATVVCKIYCTLHIITSSRLSHTHFLYICT